MLLLFFLVLRFGRLEAADCFETSTIRLGKTYSRDPTKYAAKSKDLDNGYKFAIDAINNDGGISCGGKFYNLEITQDQDDASLPANARSLYSNMIDSGNIDFLLAPYSSGVSKAASEATASRGWVIIYPGASADDLFTTPATPGAAYDPVTNDKYGRYNFGLFTPASKYQEAVIDSLVEKSVRKVCILCRDPELSTFPQKVALGALAYAEANGLEIIPDPKTNDKIMYHMDADAEMNIQNQMKYCRENGVEAILANTNSQPDGEHYVGAASHAFGQNRPWYPKVLSVTVYAAEQKYVDDMGEAALHIVGPTQWSPDLSSAPDTAANSGGTLFGTAKQFGDDFKAKYNVFPSYQAAGATASVLVLKRGIEEASKANFDQAITQKMVGDAILAFNNEPSFWSILNFQQSGLLANEKGGTGSKPMYATQIQLTTTGEIPVVLPSSYASVNTKAAGGNTKFTFEYPSLQYMSQQAGRQRGMDEARDACVVASGDDSSDSAASPALMIVFVILSVVLLLLIGVMLYMERTGEPCCAPKRLPSQLA